MKILPECAFFCLIEEHFRSDSWKRIIDSLTGHSMYNLLTVSMRVTGHPLTEPETRSLFKRIVEYAVERGFCVAIDLDPRLARGPFHKRYPEELQKIVYIRKIPVLTGEERFCIEPELFTDHMTSRGTPYNAVDGRFVRAVGYRVNQDREVIPGSVRDIGESVAIDRGGGEGIEGHLKEMVPGEFNYAAVLAEFSLFTPDVFSPHIFRYQRELLDLYGDLPLCGVVKDEWGFPPTSPSIASADAFWYSAFYADNYAKVSGGRNLIDDLLLMSVPFQNQHSERIRAINYYMYLNYTRNAEIETRYYHDVKEIFGQDAFVAKHATWYPRINEKEVFKNGLVWWAAKRDWAQADEITPLSACTAMSKKFGSPNWLNEGYSNDAAHYRRNIWRYAAAGGRMIYHPLYPFKERLINRTPGDIAVVAHEMLLSEELIRAQCRIRLLNFISDAPLDCPVALVFGHPGIMNRAGDSYVDYGEDMSLGLWRNGYAVDVYPSSEILSGTFVIDKEGFLRVGKQRYQALVFYNPNLCQREIAGFFLSEGISGTKLFMKGTWNKDFNARSLGEIWRDIKKRFISLDNNNPSGQVISYLEEIKAVKQPPLSEPFMIFGETSQTGIPGPSGTAVLVDGTVVRFSACSKSDAGDPIRETLTIGDCSFEIRAEGLFAVRIGTDGTLQALAAGGLSRICGPEIELNMDEAVDVALWHDSKGDWEGVVQDIPDGRIPSPLRRLTENWRILSIPPAIPGSSGTDRKI